MNIRTDLAIEAREMVGKGEVPGVLFEKEGTLSLRISRVKVLNEEGKKAIGKPIGTYITIETDGIRNKEQKFIRRICEAIAREINKMLNISINSTVLVVGLGNWNVTPDSLGPKVIEKIFVTKHLIEYMPESYNPEEGIRPVCALSPGVLGITGIETGEIIMGVVNRVKPSALIVIDALASRSLERIGASIQISDTGIHPGSGVGNKRMGITKEIIGIPVIAIGVPTVVDAATIANDTLEKVFNSIEREIKPGTELFKLVTNLSREEKYEMIKEVLSPYVGELVVTPKEIDSLIEDAALVLAHGINLALHPGIKYEDLNNLLIH
ncbi:GPR endopeptidase [Thermovenabulum sp.]|uniref:GPR endopeptidase n=1 Tax=Thermovenabulum sp. TaxID=3100335 RepID=UPI003C7E3D58